MATYLDPRKKKTKKRKSKDRLKRRKPWPYRFARKPNIGFVSQAGPGFAGGGLVGGGSYAAAVGESYIKKLDDVLLSPIS